VQASRCEHPLVWQLELQVSNWIYNKSTVTARFRRAAHSRRPWMARLKRAKTDLNELMISTDRLMLYLNKKTAPITSRERRGFDISKKPAACTPVKSGRQRQRGAYIACS